jgi:NAD(P)-dependent dehydrogenase (short-subunit alcohol dehydrogenase family)
MNKRSNTTGSSRGLIICTASNAGLYPFPVAPLYATSKFGVVGLVRALGGPLQQHGIQINGLAPAVIGNSPHQNHVFTIVQLSKHFSETNIAPSRDLFKDMIITPMETLIRGVSQFVANPSLSGEIAEIHGSKVTLRPPHDYVDEDSAKNLEIFANLGYA